MSITTRKLRVFPVALAAEAHYSSYFTHGLLVAHAKAYKDGLLKEGFHFDPIIPFTLAQGEDVLNRLAAEGIPAVFLMSSYVWNHDDNIAFARMIRRIMPGSLTVIGGPHVPKADKPCRRFMNVHHCIDVSVHGEGEMTLAELLEIVMEKYDSVSGSIRWTDLSSVAGLTFRQHDLQLVRTASRNRIADLDIIPSPYLTGEFEHMPQIPWTAVIETNRGCPFGCTFCDWGGATLSKIHRFDLQRILDEIEYLARKGVERILIADANFGAFERDVEIAEKLVAMKRQLGFPKTVHYFLAKNSPERVARIVRILNSEKMMVDIVASLQTTDPVSLQNIGRSNIKESAYMKLIDTYVELGLQPATDLLIGLPGQTLESFRKDLQFGFDRNIEARTFCVTILPNSPMADEDYQKKFGIVTDENGVVVSTYSFDCSVRRQMLDLRVAYMFFVEEMVLRSVLQYYQYEHGVPAVDLIAALLEEGKQHGEKWPRLAWLCSRVLNYVDWVGAVSMKWTHEDGKIFRYFPEFMEEVFAVVSARFGVQADRSELDSLSAYQSALMPLPAKKSDAFEVQLAHDVPAYSEQFRWGVPFPSADIAREKYRPLSAFHEQTLVCFPKQPAMDKKSLGFYKTVNEPQWALRHE